MFLDRHFPVIDRRRPSLFRFGRNNTETGQKRKVRMGKRGLDVNPEKESKAKSLGSSPGLP